LLEMKSSDADCQAGLPKETVELPFSAPYDWETVLAFFRAHQLPNLESVDESGYERVVRMRQGLGWFRVERAAERHAVTLTIWNGLRDDVDEIATAVRRMFDLDANPAVLLEAMKAEKFLSGFWARHPGLRVARSWSATEAMFAAVLGQLVSVRFGRVLISELMQAAGTAARHPKTSGPIFLFPSAKQILKADLSSVRTSEARRTTIRLLSQAIDSGAFDEGDGVAVRKALRSIPGVGAWTTEYVALRGFHDDDAFPATDYGLKQELKRHPKMDVNSVRPWRGYAAIALWKSFAESKGRA
jgi:DNA-3-methyladenine glycosylase II